MFTKLEKLTSEFAKKLLFSLKYRIIERRRQVTSTLMAYLECPRFLKNTSGKYLAYSDRDEIAREATNLLIRLFPVQEPETVAHEDENVDEPEIVEEKTVSSASESDADSEASASNKSDSDDFTDVLEPKPEAPIARSGTAIDIDTIKEHMDAYEKSGEKSALLQKVR